MTTIISHKLLSVLVVVLVFVIGSFVYNKHLDIRNIEALEKVQKDFIYLRKNINIATGKTIDVDVSCGSGSEKFSSSYSCHFFLKYKDGSAVDVEFRERIVGETAGLSEDFRSECGFLSDHKGARLGGLGDIYSCVFSVRPANRDKVNHMFEKYSDELFL